MGDVTDTIDRRSQAELLSLAVHEFRTPVTVVAGYLRMLAREHAGPLSEKQRKLVEEAERSCARLSALVGEMSELSHLDSGEVSPAGDTVEVAGMLDEVVASVEEGRDRDVRAVRAGSSDPVTVAADRRLLGESLRAILTAVLREQSEPGEVQVWMATSPDARTVSVGIGRDGEASRVVASADGAASLNEYRGGLGLALPIARRRIERYGGHVWSSATGRALGAVGLCLPIKETRS
jgi:signal transduction histidine kinase